MLNLARTRLINLMMLIVLSGLFSGPALSATLPDTPALPKEFKHGNPGVKLILVEFSAPWCKSCVELKPAVDKLKNEVGTKLHVVDLNIAKPETQKYMDMYHLTSVPAYFLYDPTGKPLERIEREITPEELRALVLKSASR